MINLWERSILSHDETSADVLMRIKFIGARTGETLTFAKQLSLKTSLLTVADNIVTVLPGSRMASVFPGQITIQSDEALVFVGTNRRGNEYDMGVPDYGDAEAEEHPAVYTAPSRNLTIQIEATADRNTINRIFGSLDTQFKKEKQAQVKWWYRGDHGQATFKNIYLPSLTTKLLPEFYPDLTEAPEDFLRRYMAADASVLLLAGPPGTGKTTLLRHLICDFGLSAHIVYDESLMKNDSVFQNFLFEQDSDLLIIEDADTILGARESEGNTLMARFLSVSDGLIKLPDKKLIFTTNITDFGRVDSALRRPGRCFATTQTRTLDLAEARAVAKVAGLELTAVKHEYSLAEIFNKTIAPEARKVGF